uniref:Ig-like domain-containing protein n=1 Tax=Electrophorus electricus TaxID=8005 RepID=A0AAY5EV64_ELEEL
MIHVYCLCFSFCAAFLITGLLPVTLGYVDTLKLVAESGDDVTLWCQHNLMELTYIYWFKHTNHSVPGCVACHLYIKYSELRPCSESSTFVNQSKRIVMTVNSQNISLTITAVNHIDSGLYYCGIQQNIDISFSSATYLQVTAPYVSDVFFMLMVVFAAVIVVLISVVLIMLKKKKQIRVNYAALQFSDHKTQSVAGHGEVVDPRVVYSSVRHQ